MHAKIQGFIDEYTGLVPDEVFGELIRGFGCGEFLEHEKMTPVYAHLGMIPDEDNYYLQIKNLIMGDYDIASNILEVGCGVFPLFSLMIDKEQKGIGKGNITAYDPEIRTTKGFGNIDLHKEYFGNDTNISGIDLAVAIKACEASLPFALNANKNHVPFVLGFCGCVHDGREKPGNATHDEVNQWIARISEAAYYTLPNGFDMLSSIIMIDNGDGCVPILQTVKSK